MKSKLKKRNYQLSSKDEWTNEEEDKEPQQESTCEAQIPSLFYSIKEKCP